MFRLVLSLCLALAASLPADAQPRARAMARLAGLDGKPMGTASFRAVNGGVLIELDLQACPPAPMACTCMPAASATPNRVS